MREVEGRVAELVGPREFTIRKARFGPPPAGGVMIKVTHAGVCASDLHDWLIGPEAGQPAARLGHEPVGVVHAVGDGVSGLEVGQIVTGRIRQSFADYVYANPVDLVPVPAGIDPALAIGEPLGCVLDGFRRCLPRPGSRVAVIGLGFMGLLMTRLLALSPVATVLATDFRSDSRVLAGELGASHVLTPEECDAHADSVDLVVEASGTQAGLDLAGRLTAVDGTLSVLGYHRAPGRTVDMRMWNWKGITVVNAHVRDPHRLTEATDAALRLAAKGDIPLDRLISHRFSLEEINEAYTTLAEKPRGFIKGLIDL